MGAGAPWPTPAPPAAPVFVTDLSAAVTAELGTELGPAASPSPATSPTRRALTALPRGAPERLGPIEICFANAGIAAGSDPIETPTSVWRQALAVAPT